MSTIKMLLYIAYICIVVVQCSEDLGNGFDYHQGTPGSLKPPALLWNDLSRSRSSTIPGTKIETSCRAYIEKFAQLAANFTKCSILNSRPLRFCEHCMHEYVTAKSVYHVVMDGDSVLSESNEKCGATILNSDRIQLIVQTANFLDKVWSDSDCSNCFIDHGIINNTQNYSLSDDTAKFKDLTNKTWTCFVTYSEKKIHPFHLGNDTAENASVACKECKQLYMDTNKFYVKLEEKYSHRVCMDIVDAMNFTRMLWSKTFECNGARGDIVGVLILSALFCASPILFYISTKIYGTRMEHKILEEKRLRKTQASTSQAVS